MEYYILKKIQEIGLPWFIRFIIAICSIIAGIIFVLTPIIPGLPFIIVGIALLIPGKKLLLLLK